MRQLVVHHRDGDPRNNEVENLTLVPRGMTRGRGLTGRWRAVAVEKRGGRGETRVYRSIRSAADALGVEAWRLSHELRGSDAGVEVDGCVVRYADGGPKEVEVGGQRGRATGGEAQEEWRGVAVDGEVLEGVAVSDRGRVALPSGTVTRGTRRSDGARVVYVRGRGLRVHRLVAEAFLGEEKEEALAQRGAGGGGVGGGYLTVEHVSGDMDENSAQNLRWVPRHGTPRPKRPRSSSAPLPGETFVTLHVRPQGKDVVGAGGGAGEQAEGGSGEAGGDGTVAIGVSSKGRVRLPSGRVTAGSARPGGARSVRIQGRTYAVHRLVAAAFKSNSDAESRRRMRQLIGVGFTAARAVQEEHAQAKPGRETDAQRPRPGADGQG